MADELKDIVQKSHREEEGKVVYESDPKILVAKVIGMIKKEKVIEN